MLHAGRYRPELVDRTYDELLRRAEALTTGGVSVVLDASWLDPTHRRAAATLAERTASRLTGLRCTCDVAKAAGRVARRASASDEAASGRSEATPEIARQLAESASPWPDAVEVPTCDSVADAVGLAEAVVTRR